MPGREIDRKLDDAYVGATGRVREGIDVSDPAMKPDEKLLNPYKINHAWPGRIYTLIGNSFAIESKIIDTTYETRRRACIAMVLEHGRDNRHCVSVEDALASPGFVECLSRFEFDWLKRQPPSTLLGPAFDEAGELLPDSFAVWRRENPLLSRRRQEMAVASS